MKTLLTIQSGTSRVTPVSIARQEEAVMNYLQTEGFAHATVVVWQINTIRWGKWEQGTLAFADGQEAKTSLCGVCSHRADCSSCSKALRQRGVSIFIPIV